MQRFMTKESFDGKQIRAALVKMGCEGMAKGMASEAFLPTKTFLVGMNVAGKIKGINGKILATLLWE